jgi:hypothetical protein
VRDDLVYLAGARQVWQIPWAEIEPDKTPDVLPGYWRSADSLDPLMQVRGRAFVTGDAVYLPTQSCLKRIVLSTGEIDSSFPKNGWETGKEGPGNVIVTEDHVIVAGDAQAAVYTDIALARAKLDREIADAPADPDARLHYAEVMFAGAQMDVAQARLEEAFELLGGLQALRSGSRFGRRKRMKIRRGSIAFSILPKPRRCRRASRWSIGWRGGISSGPIRRAMPGRRSSCIRKSWAIPRCGRLRCPIL